MNMDTSSVYFIKLLTAFIKNTEPPKPGCMASSEAKRNDQSGDIDWGKIYELASMHSLSGAVYLAIQRLEDSDKPQLSVLNKFKSDFFYANFRYEEQEKTYLEITKKLNEEKIEHLFFKGIVVREYYPVKQMRTLGDIDFLVHQKDQDAVRKVFTQMGYKNTSTKEHEKYRRGKTIIEAHDKIINKQFNSKVDYFSYFENVWDHAIAKENSYTLELDLNYHMVFLITHIAKHFYDFGAGVRMILDIAVIIEKFGDMLDFSYIWKELRKIKLDIFARNIFGLCGRWFNVKTLYEVFDIDEDDYQDMTKYILDGGTFGFSNNNIAISAIRKEYSKKENGKIIQLKAFWGKTFLDFNIMKQKYPFLKRFPFLLILAWAHRIYRCIVKKRSRTLKIINGIFKCTEEAENSYTMMKRIGL